MIGTMIQGMKNVHVLDLKIKNIMPNKRKITVKEVGFMKVKATINHILVTIDIRKLSTNLYIKISELIRIIKPKKIIQFVHL